MIYSRMWKFVADMNHDALVTISDVWIWLLWLFFYPGDVFLYISMAKFPAFAHFFEISGADYGGFLSGVVSFLVWFCVLGALIPVTTSAYQKYQRWFLER